MVRTFLATVIFHHVRFLFCTHPGMKKPRSYEDFMLEIGSRLTAARIAAGFEHIPDVIARYPSWSFHTYSSHESGRRRPSRDAAVKYAKAFNVDASFLRGEDLEDGEQPISLPIPRPNASYPPKLQRFDTSK